MVIVPLEPGTLTTGLWCPHCLLPSGFDVTVYALFPTCVRRVMRWRECMDCDARIPEDIP